MGMADKVWDALTSVVRLHDKLISFAGAMKEQQSKIELLTERVIRLETTLELLLHADTRTKRLRE